MFYEYLMIDLYSYLWFYYLIIFLDLNVNIVNLLLLFLYSIRIISIIKGFLKEYYD